MAEKRVAVLLLKLHFHFDFPIAQWDVFLKGTLQVRSQDVGQRHHGKTNKWQQKGASDRISGCSPSA